jgi:hypothetical protein
MAQNFGNAFLQPPHKSGAAVLKTPAGAAPKRPAQHPAQQPAQQPAERKLTFTKIFRWRLPDGQKQEPATVEVVGTFTGWKKVPLIHDRVMGGWHATIPQIQGNRTHRYMLLADGKRGQALRRHGRPVRRAGTRIHHCNHPRPARFHALRPDEVTVRRQTPFGIEMRASSLHPRRDEASRPGPESF